MTSAKRLINGRIMPPQCSTDVHPDTACIEQPQTSIEFIPRRSAERTAAARKIYKTLKANGAGLKGIDISGKR